MFYEMPNQISKTFIPGKGFIPAHRLVEVGGKKALRDAVESQKTQKYITKLGEKREFSNYKEFHGEHKKIIEGLEQGAKQLPSPKKDIVFQRPDRATQGQMNRQNTAAFAIQTGGRKGKKTMVIPKGTDDGTIAHEIAHLTPKRSGYRMYKILQDPVKTMREEARADMATKLPGGYHGSTAKPRGGYVEAARHQRAADLQRGNEIMNNPLGAGSKSKWDKASLDAYRETQDKIYHNSQATHWSGKGGKPSFHGNQHVDDKRHRRLLRGINRYDVASGATLGAVGGAYGFNRHKKKQQIRKSLEMLEMPGMLPQEDLTSIRLRDTKTGRYVASPSLVTKRLEARSLKGLGEATTAAVLAGFVANQLPQNNRTWRQNKKKVQSKLDPKLSVTLKRKEA